MSTQRTTFWCLLVALCSGVDGVWGVAHAQEVDDAVQYILDNGWSGWSFAAQCISTAGDGSIVVGEPLPIGDGRWLDCTTHPSPSMSTFEFIDNSDNFWCALGYLSRVDSSEAADPALDTQLVYNQSTDNPRIVVTADEPGSVIRASFFGALAWPFWINVSYQTISVAPSIANHDCNKQFDL